MNFTQARPLLRERLQAALDSDDPRIARLAAARTSVCFQVTDDARESTTLLLDRDPPSLAGGEEPAEITIELEQAQAQRFARGALQLPSALLLGRIGYRGPVRKYLVVDPVLRAILSDIDGSGGH